MAPLAVLVLAGPAMGQDAADFFRQNCVSCHTIGGGRLSGPDLKNVTQRQDRAWLVQFIQNPQAAMDRGDPIALRLREEARGVVMPRIVGMDQARAEALLNMIDAESKLEKSQFVGLQISDQPFTPADIAQGRRIFTGDRPLAGGGPACISCHTIRGLGGLGGGFLAPDLTKVFERMGSRASLASWLLAPATPGMQATFRQRAFTSEEILPLVALFEDTGRGGGQDARVGNFVFLLFGLGGAAAALVAFGFAWRWRFKAVRAPMVEAGRRVRGLV